MDLTKPRWAVLGVLAAFGAAQLVRPERTNPAVMAANTLEAQYDVPGEVKQVLERACADCHSNRTKWPWYSHVAPVSWLLAGHVKDGRKKMNLDDFREDLSVRDLCQELRLGKMPLQGYLLLHPEAKVSGAEIQAVCAWTMKAQAR